MTRWTRPALWAAAALSAVAVADAVIRGASDVRPPWDPDLGPSWAGTIVDVALGATYALLTVVLVAAADGIDAGRGSVRLLRRALAVDLALLAAVSLLGAARVVDENSEAAGIVGSVGFAAMFLLGVALGVALIRRADVRLSAALLIAPLALIPLAVLAETVAPGWGHPGYAEAALYIGVALLGRAAVPVGSSVVPVRTSPHS